MGLYKGRRVNSCSIGCPALWTENLSAALREPRSSRFQSRLTMQRGPVVQLEFLKGL